MHSGLRDNVEKIHLFYIKVGTNYLKDDGLLFCFIHSTFCNLKSMLGESPTKHITESA